MYCKCLQFLFEICLVYKIEKKRKTLLIVFHSLKYNPI